MKNYSLKEEESSNEKYYFGPSRLLTKQIHLKSNNGTLDFTINDGNQSQSIYVSSVVYNSQAYLQGMRPGDQIISINGIQDINSKQALQVFILFFEDQNKILSFF
jgi:C-terminal processing protease CtpA/Prc